LHFYDSIRKSTLPEDLPDPLKHALGQLGFNDLFSHQLEVRRNILQNKDVVITTPTSSGKTIAFNVPVFENLIKFRHQASALYLFPLNALASDQEDKIKKLNEKLPPDLQMRILILSGQTKSHEREKMMAQGVPDIIITNPDILHYQLSRYKEPAWQNWRQFLERLRILVLDEAHSNTGVFGTNVSNLFRRLYIIMNRIKPGSHARLRFIIASATVGNALDLARRLMGRKGIHRLCWIKESGAAAFERSTICLAAESNSKLAVAKLINMIVLHGMNGIVFVNSIQAVYDLMQFMQQYGDKSSNGKPFDQASKVCRVYNASMDQGKKNQVLADFKKGKCRVVISTNALEAGVRDICAVETEKRLFLTFRSFLAD
jgi:DEAD/DEAH box helicase domain-containing protein